MAANVAHLFFGHHRVVYAYYHIALFQSGLGGGHVLVGLVDNNAVQLLMLAHHCTYAGVLAGKHLSQILGLILRVVFGIGVKTAQHGVYGRAHSLLWVQRVYVQQIQILIHVVQNIKLLGHFKVMVALFLSHCRGGCHRHHAYTYNNSILHNLAELMFLWLQNYKI